MRPERLQAAYSVLRPVAKFSAVYDVHTADFQRVDFAAIKRNTETLDATARRQIANVMAAAVWKLIGDADRMRELLDQDVSDIAQVKIDAFDIGKLKAACKQALVNAWELGAAQSRREIIKSSGHKFSYDESQHPRDERGRWTDSGSEGEEGPIEGSRIVSDAAAINAVPMLHTTKAADAIMASGFRLSDTSMYGEGVYFSDKTAGSSLGKQQLRVELAPHKQLVLENDTDISAAFVKITGMTRADLISTRGREAMLSAGYGSARFPVDDQIYTLVYDPSLIRIVGRVDMSRISFAKKPTTLRDNAAAYLDANGMRMAQNLGDGARAMIQQELTRAVRTGISPTEAAAIILDRLASKGFTDREGIEGAGVTQDVLDEMEALDDIADVPAYINTLVRTNTFEAMNEARFAEFTDPELDGWVVAFEYSAILDENTTEFCRYMDGRVYAADNEVWDTHRPPNHYNCRSLLIPITKASGWDGQESEPPEVDPATGFARCGCGKEHGLPRSVADQHSESPNTGVAHDEGARSDINPLQESEK